MRKWRQKLERAPNLYSLTIRPDQPPEIVLRDPKTDLDLPANAVLPLMIEARDPDFTLRYVNLKIEKDGSPLIGPEIYEGHDQQFKTTYRWSLKEYHFRPKETITYWLQAQDNRKPFPGTSNTSPRLRIHITDPVPDSQVQKDLELAEKRQQEEAKHAEDDRNTPQKQDQDQVADATKPQANRTKDQPKENEQKVNAHQEEARLPNN